MTLGTVRDRYFPEANIAFYNAADLTCSAVGARVMVIFFLFAFCFHLEIKRNKSICFTGRGEADSYFLEQFPIAQNKLYKSLFQGH